MHVTRSIYVGVAGEKRSFFTSRPEPRIDMAQVLLHWVYSLYDSMYSWGSMMVIRELKYLGSLTLHSSLKSAKEEGYLNEKSLL